MKHAMLTVREAYPSFGTWRASDADGSRYLINGGTIGVDNDIMSLGSRLGCWVDDRNYVVRIDPPAGETKGEA